MYCLLQGMVTTALYEREPFINIAAAAASMAMRSSGGVYGGRGRVSTSSFWHSPHNNVTSSYQNERPHSCKYCGKRFINTSHLRDHERLHTGERPFKCNRCSKTFVQNQHLRVHEKKGKCTPTYCNICSDVFPNEIARSMHMATIHILSQSNNNSLSLQNP